MRKIIVLILVICGGIVMIVAAGFLLKSGKAANDFLSCKNAGGAILESYPEQCVLNGKSFTNDKQSINSRSGGYVGLPESAALSKAASENKAARVVERDGEALPATADYSPGRLNLYVRDGNVYKVQVEGEEGR
jgi:hypothetical protein